MSDMAALLSDRVVMYLRSYNYMGEFLILVQELHQTIATVCYLSHHIWPGKDIDNLEGMGSYNIMLQS